MQLAIEAFRVLRQEGWRPFLAAIRRKLLPGTVNSKVRKQLGNLHPTVSIVIPTFNTAWLTGNCIRRIYETHCDVSFEVVVVDDHSSDSTARMLAMEQKRQPTLKSYYMRENLGFPGAVNYGCRQSAGRYVVILNSDTLVTNGWLDRLVDPFSRDEFIGIVSPVTNYVGEGPQIDEDARQISPEDIESYARKIEACDYIYESNRLVFYCVAISRRVLDVVGDLDVGYGRGNYEDEDYCLRTIAAGFRLAIVRGAFVYHFGTMTFKKNSRLHARFMIRNRRRFYRKAQSISVTLRQPKLRTPDFSTSVIVRTQDRPELLREALISLSNQTIGNFEVVVVNDGGPDVSGMLSMFEQYFPLRYVHNTESKGRSAALNIGINHSKGSWIAILDDDDIFYPWHLDALLSNARINPDFKFFYSSCNQCMLRSRSQREPLMIIGINPWNYDRRELLVRNHLPIHSWLIARSCFDKVGRFREDMLMLEDFEFLVRLSRAFDFHHVPRLTCEYRYYLDGANAMLTQRRKTFEAL